MRQSVFADVPLNLAVGRMRVNGVFNTGDVEAVARAVRAGLAPPGLVQRRGGARDVLVQ